MNVCVLGNSHLASLILGWRQIQQEFADTKLTFYGAPGRLMEFFDVKDGNLVAGHADLRQHLQWISGSGDAIVTGDFDGYVIYALAFGIRNVLGVFAGHRGESLRADERQPVSDHCFMRAIEDVLLGSTAVSLIRRLQQITDAPILLVPQPMSSDQDRVPWTLRTLEAGEDRIAADTFSTVTTQIADRLGIQVMFQPADTLTSPMLTNSSYSRGSVRLGGGLTTTHPDDDVTHMNAEYGAIILKRVLQGGVFRDRADARPMMRTGTPGLNRLFRQAKSGLRRILSPR